MNFLYIFILSLGQNILAVFSALNLYLIFDSSQDPSLCRFSFHFAHMGVKKISIAISSSDDEDNSIGKKGLIQSWEKLM